MERLQKIGENFIAMFRDASALDYLMYLLEIILIFALIYYVFKVLRENSAKKLIIVYISLIALVGVLCLFTKGLGAITFLAAIVLISMFMLLLFATEIKRSLFNVRKNVAPVPIGTITKTRAATELCISSIIKALQSMSKNDIGALIVLSNGNLPKQILDSGVMVDADISQQMVEAIFFKNAPLHDGAMIINGHKIQAAGCFLPLTQQVNCPKELGTRHRAGIGITEVAPVSALIVSEETGIISIVQQGNITRYADYNMLRAILQEYYWKDFTLDVRGGKK